MNKIKVLLILLIMVMFQNAVNAAFWSKSHNESLGNEIVKEEYPESKDVEPVVENEQSYTIAGGVEEVIDISLEECLCAALGNNPRIQAALQDVFASDARIKQAWSSYFPQFHRHHSHLASRLH